LVRGQSIRQRPADVAIQNNRFLGFPERDGRERPHVDKKPAYAVNPESERAENRDVLTWDLVNSRFARLKCNRARTAFQEEHKANKNYRQFYRQSAFPAMTFSNL
jgi:hypothetical protein